MKLITRDTDYAVRALCQMAKEKEKRFSVVELVKDLGVPRPYLRKILQILTKKGILNSFKGLGGGFSLAIEPERIFLVDLMEIFQGPIKINECILKKKVCPDVKKCPLKREIDSIEDHIVQKMKSVTINSLVNPVI